MKIGPSPLVSTTDSRYPEARSGRPQGGQEQPDTVKSGGNGLEGAPNWAFLPLGECQDHPKALPVSRLAAGAQKIPAWVGM